MPRLREYEAQRLSEQLSSARLVCKYQRDKEPSVLLCDTYGRQWLKLHGGVRILSPVERAGHLQLTWCDCSRADPHASGLAAKELANWLCVYHVVSVAARTWQHWLSKDWSASGELQVSQAVEDALGVRLRLDQCSTLHE